MYHGKEAQCWAAFGMKFRSFTSKCNGMKRDVKAENRIVPLLLEYFIVDQC